MDGGARVLGFGWGLKPYTRPQFYRACDPPGKGAGRVARPPSRRGVLHLAGDADRAGLRLGLRPLREHPAGGGTTLRHNAGRSGHNRSRAVGVASVRGKGAVFLAVVGAVALVLYFLGVGEIPLLFGGALLVLSVRIVQRRRGSGAAAFAPFGLPLGLLVLPSASTGLIGLFLVPEKRGRPFRQRLRAFGFLSFGVRRTGPSGRPRTTGCRSRRPSHAGSSLYHRYLRRVLASGGAGGSVGHGGHLLAGVRLRGPNRPHYSPLKRIPDPGGVTRRGERGLFGAHGGGYLAASPGLHL